MVNDTISDVLTRIRNAQRAGHKLVRVPSTKLAKSVLNVLKSEGFIDTFDQVKDEEKGFPLFAVYLKYYESGLPAISVASRVSKPGQRKYSSLDKLPKPYNGLGISILSTSRGVMSDREARKKKIGGEVLALIS